MDCFLLAEGDWKVVRFLDRLLTMRLRAPFMAAEEGDCWLGDSTPLMGSVDESSSSSSSDGLVRIDVILIIH